VPQDRLDRVRVPAGLDLGPTTHREIAVAILAELVQLRAAGALVPAAPAASAPAAPVVDQTVTDPVCGMTVTPGPGVPTAEVAGVSYWFCRAGCRQSFERDPGAYLSTKTETRC
jgi:xanthine dehydrogenase accessory factor